jgi:predicted nucleic acid-binding protein
MPGAKIKLYWDACVLLAWLKNEKRLPGEMEGLRDVVARIDSGEYILVASVLLRTEVLTSSLTPEAANKFEMVLRRGNVTVRNIDDRIATLASELRVYYENQKKIDGRPSLATPDSLHLATAIHYRVDEFHTFDEKDKGNGRGLLPLNGNVGGYRLMVCKPSVPQRSLGLR